jgi:hypothetical protein
MLASGARLHAQEADAATRAQWRKVFDTVASGYQLAREPDHTPLKLIDRPAYIWARSGPHLGTYGAVYVWTQRGAAEAVACFWRNPGADGQASVVHELHSLSPVVLTSSGKDSDSWKPKTGLKRQLLSDAPAPAMTASSRMLQMRSLCRDFSAHSVGAQGDRTELRLLPQPLYRYESDKGGFIDGALFAFVCSIGTDPEVFLLLEASDVDGKPKWQFAPARFSHMDLHVSFKDREVWTALRDRENTLSHNVDHTYWVFGQPFDQIKPRESDSEE